MQVLVTGASGKTGALVVAELLKQPGKFTVRAVVRSTAVRVVCIWPRMDARRVQHHC